MWFRRRKKPLIQSFVVLCLLLLITCQLYKILIRHEPSSDELWVVGRNPGLGEVVPPMRPGQDGKDSKDTGRRVVAGQDNEFNIHGVTGKSRERIGGVVVGTAKGDRGQGEAFRSDEIVNRTLFMNNQRRLQTELKDIFISVKTTGKFHKTRVEVLLKTWFGLAADQVNKKLFV